MSLFHFGKKDANPAPACACGAAGNNAPEKQCCGQPVSGVCCIKVLGSGCKACHTLYENAKQAAAEAGLDTPVEYITDMEKIMEFGVMSMPALVVNDKVVAMGKVLKAEEVKKYLE